MDAKSFIRTFENVFDQLAELRIQVQEHCEELENTCYKAEMQHRKNVNELTGSFDVSFTSHLMICSPPNSWPRLMCRMYIGLMIPWRRVLMKWEKRPLESESSWRRWIDSDHVHRRAEISLNISWILKRADPRDWTTCGLTLVKKDRLKLLSFFEESMLL